MKRDYSNLWGILIALPFIVIGIVGFYFAFQAPQKVPFYGWIIFLAFILVPLYAISPFKPSKKSFEKVKERNTRLSFDLEKLTIHQIVFDLDELINWAQIDTVIFADYFEEKQFILYLNAPPKLSFYETRWWPNKFFKSNPVSKKVKIRVYESWYGFRELPEQLKTHLNIRHLDIDLRKDSRRGLLLEKTQDGNTTTEHWQPETKISSWHMVYDRFNRSVDDIYARDGSI